MLYLWYLIIHVYDTDKTFSIFLHDRWYLKTNILTHVWRKKKPNVFFHLLKSNQIISIINVTFFLEKQEGGGEGGKRAKSKKKK